MSFKKILLTASVLVMAVTSANARDVNLLNFRASVVEDDQAAKSNEIVLSRSAALGDSPFASPVSGNASVSDTMRASVTPVVDFPQTGAFDAIQSIDLDNLPTSRLPIPAWMTRERNLPLAMPAISSAPAGCDGAQYVPAWWLSKAAEARRAYYFPTMAAIACEAGIPTLLFDALITQESGYNPLAVSSAGAAGLSQIIPDTARYLGLLTPFEPVANMKAGARYLREQLIRFGGRSDLALAAYNAGPGRVQKKWAVPRIRETVNYVNVITLNWSRLATMQQPSPDFIDRGQLAAAVVDSFPYRRATFLNFSAR